MKKLIHSFEQNGRKFEVVNDNGQLYCCLVRNFGDGILPDTYIGYSDAGVDMYQSQVLWHFEIDKDEAHLEDVLYQRFLSQTDFLRYIGAV